MKISRKVQYGLIAIVEIGIHSTKDENVTLIDISQRNGVNLKFLENIMVTLKVHRLVLGQRGCKNGGYKLRKDAKNITLTEILNALDETILDEFQEEYPNNAYIQPILNEVVWNSMNKTLLSFTDNITLSMIIDGYEKNS